MLGLWYYLRTSSSFSEQLSCHCAWASYCGGFLQSMGSRCTGTVVVVHVFNCPVTCGSFQTRDQTCILCIGRWILNHWTTRKPRAHLLQQEVWRQSGWLVAPDESEDSLHPWSAFLPFKALGHPLSRRSDQCDFTLLIPNFFFCPMASMWWIFSLCGCH